MARAEWGAARHIQAAVVSLSDIMGSTVRWSYAALNANGSARGGRDTENGSKKKKN